MERHKLACSSLEMKISVSRAT